jgi:hypothetical protein
LVDHTLNCASTRIAIDHNGGDHEAFRQVLVEAVTRHVKELLAYLG